MGFFFNQHRFKQYVNKHSISFYDYIYYSGLFTNGAMPMEYIRNKKSLGIPSLELMTETALKVISKNENGFFLMVCIVPKINKTVLSII